MRGETGRNTLLTGTVGSLSKDLFCFSTLYRESSQHILVELNRSTGRLWEALTRHCWPFHHPGYMRAMHVAATWEQMTMYLQCTVRPARICGTRCVNQADPVVLIDAISPIDVAFLTGLRYPHAAEARTSNRTFGVGVLSPRFRCCVKRPEIAREKERSAAFRVISPCE